jgi:hypothetical protein
MPLDPAFIPPYEANCEVVRHATNTGLRANDDHEHESNLCSQQQCTMQDQLPLEDAALETLSNGLPRFQEEITRHNDVQAASSCFHAAGGRGSQLQSDNSQTSGWEEEVVSHGAQNQALVSKDPAEEDALRYDGPLVDNWSSDEVDSGPPASPRSQVCESSADTCLQYSKMRLGVLTRIYSLPL